MFTLQIMCACVFVALFLWRSWRAPQTTKQTIILNTFLNYTNCLYEVASSSAAAVAVCGIRPEE
jgi:hypothetical protein